MTKTLKSLIRGQKISIDAHKTGVPFDWNHDDIHLHKKMNRNGKHAQMRIHLNSNHLMDFIFDEKDGNTNEKSIVKEIKEVLNGNQKTVYDLCKYLIQNLWNSKEADNQKHLYDVIDHIAAQFDLSADVSRQIMKTMYRAIKEYTPDEASNEVYFTAITHDNKIIVGERTTNEYQCE